jgi:hypothetical protein
MSTLKDKIRTTLGLQPYERILHHRMVLSKFRVKPDFIITGIQKGGTTSLFKYLAQHPNIGTSFVKEVQFFNRSYHRGESYFRANYPTGLKKVFNPSIIYGEASPDYMDNPVVPKRIKEYLPNIKLVFLLRNPIDRAYSQYKMIQELGFEDVPFEKAIFLEKHRLGSIMEQIKKDDTFYHIHEAYYNYLSKGMYAEQLKRWLKYFDKKQMLILKSEDLFEKPEKIYQQTENFLGVAHFPLKDFKAYNTRSYDKIGAKTRDELKAYFSKPNQELYDLIGQNYGWE